MTNPTARKLLTPAWEAAGRICGICGARVEGQPVVDHRVPLSQGGERVLTNAQLAHSFCNQTKRDYVQESLHGIHTVIRSNQ